MTNATSFSAFSDTDIQGELPFQPFAGTRKDRDIMRRILDTKPSGVISGLNSTFAIY
jgi:hypothetical protein